MTNSVTNVIFFKYVVLILIGIFFNTTIKANHLIGGDVIYNCIGQDTINNTITLRVEFQLFRDNRCTTNPTTNVTCAFFDGDGRGDTPNPGAEFGVYRFTGGRWIFVQDTDPLSPQPIENVPLNELPCLRGDSEADVEIGRYVFDITLPIIDDNYMIAYQRCCRGENINNLINPTSFGSVFSIELTPEAMRSCNNSPVFNEPPPLLVCAGFDLSFDHSASDIEGDSIVYEFCIPLSSGGSNGRASRNQCNESPVPLPSACSPDGFREVPFLFPAHEVSAPLGVGPDQVIIDSQTGQLTGIPSILGEHVVVVCANEFRDGVLLSRIRREFLYIVSICETTVNAAITADQTDGTNFNLISCGDLDVQFDNISTREEDIITNDWVFDFGNGDVEISQEQDPLVTFPTFGTFDAMLVINEGVPNCTDSAFITVRVFPGLDAEFQATFDTCEAGPVLFTDMSMTDDVNFINNWTWDYDDGNSISGLDQNPLHTYRAPGTFDVSLTITDNNGCQDELIQELVYAPAPNTIIVEPSRFIGCAPAEIFFNNLSFPIDETFDIVWDFGDGSDGDNIFDLSPVHFFEEPGVFTVSVDIVSPLGCFATRTFPNLINVQAGPEADFTTSPEAENISISNSTVSFINQTVGGVAYFWDFGDGGISFEQNPQHTFQDTGMFDVHLLATSSNGCTDTITQLIDVVPVANLQFPNAFTPNGDGSNDLFRGKGATELINDYEIFIFDRFGKIVFNSENSSEGWNGQHNNSGADLPPGVYMFRATWREPRGDEDFAEGAATLVR